MKQNQFSKTKTAPYFQNNRLSPPLIWLLIGQPSASITRTANWQCGLSDSGK